MSDIIEIHQNVKLAFLFFFYWTLGPWGSVRAVFNVILPVKIVVIISGQLVGVFLDKYELYVRGIVVLTTRLGLIGVLALELGTFVLVPSVKPLPALSMSSEGAYNVHCNIVIKDDGFVMEVRYQSYVTNVQSI